MSIETGILVYLDGGWEVHTPPGRSSVYLPDSPDLWSLIWEDRDQILGFAHSHPGSGVPSPSSTDITTFDAIEKALGRSLVWWICSDSHIIVCRKVGSNWTTTEFDGIDLTWLPELRWESYSSSAAQRSVAPAPVLDPVVARIVDKLEKQPFLADQKNEAIATVMASEIAYLKSFVKEAVYQSTIGLGRAK